MPFTKLPIERVTTRLWTICRAAYSGMVLLSFLCIHC